MNATSSIPYGLFNIPQLFPFISPHSSCVHNAVTCSDRIHTLSWQVSVVYGNKFFFKRKKIAFYFSFVGCPPGYTLLSVPEAKFFNIGLSGGCRADKSTIAMRYMVKWYMVLKGSILQDKGREENWFFDQRN